MSEHKVIVAAIQLNASEDKDKNLETATGLIDRAAALGARVVILPEMFNYVSTTAEMVRHAESIGDKTINTLAEKAKANKINIICGSMLEKATENKAYNTSVTLNPEGEIIQIYRKIHLFDVDVAGQVTFKESDAVKAGDKIVTMEIEGFSAGIAICYDLRFPELFRILALRGAQAIFMPSAFTAATGRFHWEPLLKARAIENQVFIAAANQFGTYPNAPRTYGRSMIIDPYGRVLAEAGTDTESIITATLDLDLLENTRKEIPLFQHRRSDLYEVNSFNKPPCRQPNGLSQDKIP